MGWVAPRFPSQFFWKKAVRLGFCFSCGSLRRLGLPTNLLLLSLPLCPDHSNFFFSTEGEGERENSSRGLGQCQPSISVLPALNEVTSNHPNAFKKTEKNRCHSTNSRCINHCPSWLSLQTLFFKLMFWYLLGFLLCSVSEFQQEKDNKILSLAQLVINSTKKSFSLALPMIASLKGL